ncbi:MAG: MOSC domain-containing protein [Salinigranum sp.]
MERTGRIEHIHVAADSGEPMEAREAVEAVAGRGLRGDRYFENRGLWNVLDEEGDTQEASQVTLIEREVLDALERDFGVSLDPGRHRRNVTTRGVALNHLVGERFRVGEAVCEGVGLCEPCGYLQSMTGEADLAKHLAHRGGLNARVVESGTVAVGDAVRW